MTGLRPAAWLTLAVLGCASSPPRGPETAQPSSPAMLYASGRTAAARGDSTRAEQYLVLAVREGYPAERAIGPLVEACIAGSRLRSALAHAQAFLRRHPAAWRLRVLSASLRIALGEPEAAVRELGRVLAQRPAAADARYLMAVIERDVRHDDDAARAQFNAYLALAPSGRFAAEAEDWLLDHPGPRAVPAHEEARP